MAPTHTTSSAVNGPLWGERAADFASIQEGQCRLVYEAVLTRCLTSTGMDLLDDGCGSGMAAALAASLGATVTGIDASAELLEIARTRVPLAAFLQGDLESLPFADASFDLITGFNSFQYATDPLAALREARRVARPGATVVIMTWSDPAGMQAAAIVSALRSLLPTPPPDAPGPFALSDKAAITAFAVQAGLHATDILDVISPWTYPDLPTAVRGLASTGIAARARHLAGAEAVDAAHAVALAPFVQSDGSLQIGATFRCLFATA